MKVRSKLALIILPIIIVSIVLINMAFGIFFENHVVTQEANQINILKSNFDSFFEAKKQKYLGNVKDWAHWDDTYQFAVNQNSEYERNNILESTFSNLDINFFVLTDKNNEITYKKYYSFEKGEFCEFSSNSSNEFKKALRSLDDYNDYGIYKIEDSFYFVAASIITDSVEEGRLDKKLVFGRQIDNEMISEIENITQCRVVSINTVDTSAIENTNVMKSEYDNSNQYVNNIECYVANTNIDSSISVRLIFQRELYKSGIEKVKSFSILNTALSIAIGAVIIYILWRFLSNPFNKVMNEVKNINLTNEEFVMLPEVGKDEFYYLRQTINNMLSRLETVQNELRDNKEKLHATLFSVGDGVISVDRMSRIQFLNPVAEKLTGWALEEAYNQPMDDVFHIINEYTREPVESPVNTVFEKEEIVELTNHTILVSRGGEERPIEDTAAPIRDRNGDIIGCVLVFRDFSERKEKQRRIEYLSYHDQLTGVYNRRYFEDELKRQDTAENLPLSFLYIDVNGLKTINDAFGHQVGDQFIQKISEVFISECRSKDIVARTGGDEFVILMPKTSINDAEKLANRIKEKASKIRVMEIEISVSIGWDEKNTVDQNIRESIKRAEDRMYQKKLFDTTSKRNGIIQSIMNSLLVKNPREEAHSKRVSVICEEIGKAFMLNDDDIKELKVIGSLHDIGKIAIDESILNKDGTLSESEWAQIQKHPETGYRLLGTSNDFTNIAVFILAHHERLDGTGYPRGLKGDEIPWKARVVAVADSYDAMTSDRPYRKALSKDQAIAELIKNSGIQFDTDIVKVFVESVANKI